MDDDNSYGSSSSSASGSPRPTLCAYNLEGQRDFCPETLELLRRNDPSLTCLSVSWNEEWDSGESDNSYEPRFVALEYAHRVDWTKAGRALVETTQLKKLRIASFPSEWESDKAINKRSLGAWLEFCEAVSRNRSIEHLQITDITASVAHTLIGRLAHFLDRNRNMRRLHFSYTLNSSDNRSDKENVTLLASALKNCASTSALEELSIVQIKEMGSYLGGKDVDKANVCKLIMALKGHRNLAKLELDYCNIGKNGCRAVGKLLRSTECNIAELSLSCNRIHDKCIDALTKGLVNNSKLRALNLMNNAAVTSSGWRAFFRALRGSSLVLERLNLEENWGLSDAAVAAFAKWLKQQSNLVKLSLGAMHSMSSRDWPTIFRSLENLSSLEELFLNHNSSIDDTGAACLANALPNSLRKLYICPDLHYRDSISISGWTSLATLLQNGNMELKELGIGPVRDNVLSAFAPGLYGNNALETFYACFGGDSVDLFSNALCDTSSIGATFSSNHTLRSLMGSSVYTKEPLCTYLEMNCNPNKSKVARQKILQHHFSGDRLDANFEMFLGMETGELPHAVAWVGRDDDGLPMMYRLIRSMPSVVEQEGCKMAGAKRARGEYMAVVGT